MSIPKIIHYCWFGGKKKPELVEKCISSWKINLKDYELVLLSNYFEESQRNRLCAMGINDFFIEYYGEKIIKPNEEVYINAAGPYKPRECIIVGDDKLLDIDIPYYLGFNTIYVNEKGDIKNVEDITLKLIKLKESRNI